MRATKGASSQLQRAAAPRAEEGSRWGEGRGVRAELGGGFSFFAAGAAHHAHMLCARVHARVLWEEE